MIKFFKRKWIRFKARLCYLKTWIPLIWKDEQWDQSFMWEMLSVKLKLMEEFFRSSRAYRVDSDKVADQIHQARMVLNRYLNHDYLDSVFGRDDESTTIDDIIKGRKRLEEIEYNFFVGKKKNAFDYEHYMKSQDLEYLGKLLKKSARWWD